jgi:Tfp pilus assembly protein PilO
MAKSKSTKNVSTTNFIALMLVISLVVVIGGGFAGYSLVKNIVHTKHILDKKTVAKKTLDQNVVAARTLVSEYDAATANKNLLSNALPVEADFPAFANAVEMIAGVSSVKLSGIGTGLSGSGAPSAETASVVPMPIKLSFTSSYANLSRFLTGLESSARPIHISGITMSGTNQNLSVSLDATTYYQNPAAFSITMEAVK